MSSEKTLSEGLVQYFSILLRYRWLIIVATSAAAILVTAYCIISIRLPPERSPLPNLYTASAVLLVQKGVGEDLSMSIRSALGVLGTSQDSEAGFDTGALMIMVMQSRSFLDKIVEEFGIVERYRITEHIKSNSRKQLLKSLRLDNNRATGAVTISFTDTNPEFARDLTNRIVSLVNEWFAQNMGSSKQRQKQLLEDKMKEVKSDVDRISNRVTDMQNKYGVLTAQDLGNSQATSLAALRSQLILKEIDIKNYSNLSTGEDPKMQQLQQERRSLLDLISRVQQGAPDQAENTANASDHPDLQTEFTNLTIELDVQRKIYNTLSHQYEVLKLTSDYEPPFQVMELAEAPDAKSGPQRSGIVVKITFIVFIASVALAFLLNGISKVGRNQFKPIPKKGS